MNLHLGGGGVKMCNSYVLKPCSVYKCVVSLNNIKFQNTDKVSLRNADELFSLMVIRDFFFPSPFQAPLSLMYASKMIHIPLNNVVFFCGLW